MADAISVTRAGHRTFFKWHRGRRRGSDPVFTGRRIIEGMQLGASVEVDLVIHADDGMAVLHNLSLERETTGGGLVRNTSAETLRGLHLRDNDGQPIDDKVMLLEDLAALIARDGAHPEGLLQLDYKEDAAA
ncbi:MAG: glycerophosphodiester phosphodiesterase, partial [Devosia sp.]|nr:glycerophosphodiester phosphodiesterase [Devosia sp.]